MQANTPEKQVAERRKKSLGQYKFQEPLVIYAKKPGDEIKRIMTCGSKYSSSHNSFYGGPVKLKDHSAGLKAVKFKMKKTVSEWAQNDPLLIK